MKVVGAHLRTNQSYHLLEEDTPAGLPGPAQADNRELDLETGYSDVVEVSLQTSDQKSGGTGKRIPAPGIVIYMSGE